MSSIMTSYIQLLLLSPLNLKIGSVGYKGWGFDMEPYYMDLHSQTATTISAKYSKNYKV